MGDDRVSKGKGAARRRLDANKRVPRITKRIYVRSDSIGYPIHIIHRGPGRSGVQGTKQLDATRRTSASPAQEDLEP